MFGLLMRLIRLRFLWRLVRSPLSWPSLTLLVAGWLLRRLRYG